MAGNWRLLSSVVLGTIVAGAILSATVVYSDAIRDLGLKFALDRRDPTTLDVAVSRTTQTLGSVQYQRSGDNVDRAVTSALGPAFESEVRTGRSATFYPAPAGQLPDFDDDTRPRGNVLFRSDLDAHIRVVEGALPAAADPDVDAPVPAAVGAATAALNGIAVGDQFDLFPFWDNDAAPLPVEVVAIVEPLDIEDRYWGGDAAALDAPSRSWETVYFVVPESTFFGVLPDRFPQIVGDYGNYYQVRLEALDARNALPIANALARLPLALNQTEQRTRAQTDLIEVLRSFDEKLFFTRIPLFVLLLQIGAIVGYYLVMVSTMLTERQTAEIATLRSRGATTGQLLAQYGVEGVILAAVAVAAGPPLAALVISALGPTPAFSDLSGGSPLEVHLGGQAYILAGVGAVLAFVALVIPAWLATRSTVVEFKRASARPRPTPAFLRYYLDVALVLLVALVFWRLSREDQLFTETLFGETQVDPFLLATPAVFMVTVGVVFLRLFPLALRLVGWLVSWTRSVAAVVSVRSLVRNPTHYTRLVLLLMFATGVGMFGATFSATLDRSYTQRADYEAGADVRASEIGQLTDVGNVTFIDTIEALPARAAMPVVRTGGSLDVIGRFERVEVIGIDPERFDDVAFWRDDFADVPLDELIGTLAEDSVVERGGMAIPGDAAQIGVWIKAPDIRGAFSVAAVVRDATGKRGEFWLANIRPDDLVSEQWFFLSADLSFQLSRTGRPLNRPDLEPPFTFDSLLYTTSSRIAAARGTILAGPVYTTTVAPDGELPGGFPTGAHAVEPFEGATLLADLTDPRFEVVDGFTAAGTPDQLTTSTDAPPGSTLAARLDWSSASRASQVHGIREAFDAPPLRIYLSSELAADLELRPGDPVRLSAFARYHQAVVAGTFDLFPTFRPDESTLGLAVVNGARLIEGAVAAQSDRAPVYNEAWFATDDRDATVEAVTALAARTIVDAETELLTQQEDPLVAAGWAGILAISFGAVLLLSAIGFIVYSYLSAQQRGLEFAILRTLGFSRIQVFTVVIVEQFFIIAAGMGLGTIVGLQVGRLMMDFLATDERGRDVLPPFALAVSWPEVFFVWGILGVVFVLTITTVVLLYLRLAVHRALRIGDA